MRLTAKITAIIFVIISLFGSMVTVTQAAESTNLILGDPTFESYATGDNALAFNNVDMFKTNAAVQDGGADGSAKSYLLAGGWKVVLHQEKTNYVEAGKTYEFGTWIKGASKPYVFSLEVYGTAGAQVIDLIPAMPAGIADWTYVKTTFVAPAGAGQGTSTENGYILFKMQSGNDPISVDNITVKEIVPVTPSPEPVFGPELIKNGKFTNALTDWTDGSTAKDLAVANTDPVDGDYVKITTTGWGNGANQKVYGITPGQYRISYDYKGRSMIWFGPNEWDAAPSAVDNPYGISETAWANKTIDFTVTSEASSGYYTLRLIADATGTQFDNVSLRKMDDPNATPTPDLTGVIADSGFEGTALVSYPNAGWSSGSSSNGTPALVKATTEGITAFAGEGVGKLQPLNGASIFRQRVLVKEGQTYALTYYVKGTMPTYETVLAGCINAWGNEEAGHEPAHNSAALGVVTTTGEADANGWVKVTKEFTTISNYINITIRADNWTETPATATYIDAMSLVEAAPATATPVPTATPSVGPTTAPTTEASTAPTATPTAAPAANKIRGDGTFESYPVGKVTSSEVFDYLQNDAANNAQIVEGGANGTDKAFSFDSQWQSVFQQAPGTYALQPNTTYKFSSYVKGKIFKVILAVPGSGATQTMDVVEYNGAEGPAEWTKIEKVFTTGSDTSISNGFAYFIQFQAGGNGAFVDEISIVEYTATPEPTLEPTAEPTVAPTAEPTAVPTEVPTLAKPATVSINSATTTISGKYSVSGAKITVYKGSKAIGSATVSGGKYSVKIAKQAPGTKLTIKATKSGYNASPVTTVTTGLQKSTVSANSKSVYVSGKAYAKASVTIYYGSKKIGSGKASSKGTYKVKISKKIGKGKTITVKTSYKSYKSQTSYKLKK